MNLTLKTQHNKHLSNLCGVMNEHIQHIKQRLNIEIHYRGDKFSLSGKHNKLAKNLLQTLHQKANQHPLTTEEVEQEIKNILAGHNQKPIYIKTPEKNIEVNSDNQQSYIKQIKKKSCIFAIGPAGTGKTYLAVAKAVEQLEHGEIERIILVRPVIEAGEKLGFLPGDLNEKVDPYLRPIYDALYLMLGYKHTEKLIEQQIIEIAPLAFMRGRTLNNAFIILDEAQNTTTEQMKMFLTRLGFGSKMVITGDISQIDLPKHIESGLKQAITILKDEEEISFIHLNTQDVMRHHLVNRIILAYDKNRDDCIK